MKPYYITTSIHYPNAKPHMGHALELVQADFLARYQRRFGQVEVRFQSGLDEHGLKIQRTAEAEGLTTETFVERQQALFADLVEKLGVQPDRFIRTTEAAHKEMAQAIWRAAAKRGDIYKKVYRAWYDVKEEAFLGSADEITDPKVFGVDERFLELIEEENYFFTLSKYTAQITELLRSGTYAIVPENRAKEMLSFIEDKGLQDISISRHRSKLAWGVPVPDDDSQVMYVWFDALTNYLTGAASVDGQGIIQPDAFWPANLHCVGKDISRFHALMWPAMLLSAGLALPEKLLVHGFVLGEAGRKMSKSLGNGVDPIELLERYSSTTLRWYLLKEIPTTDDGSFTETRLREVYASDLANDFGNLVSRVLTMCQKYSDGAVPSYDAERAGNVEQVIIEQKWGEYHDAVARLAVHEALQAAHDLVVFANKRIEELKPWAMAKDPEKMSELHEFLYELLEVIRQVTLMYVPAMPDLYEAMVQNVFAQVGDDVDQPQFGVLKPGTKLNQEPLILFPRLS